MIFMEKRRSGRKGRTAIKYLVVLLAVCLVSVIGLLGDISHAEDVSIAWNGQAMDPSVVYDLKSGSMVLNLKTTGAAYEDKDTYEVRWSIVDSEKEDIATIEQSSDTQTMAILRAHSPGVVEVAVIVLDKKDGLAQVANATCQVRVVFSIDTTTDDSIYKLVNDGDADKSLVLYANDKPVTLKQSIDSVSVADTIQWTSANDEVAKVERRTGVLTPVGAGKTQVMATYNPRGSDETYTGYLDVYIIPQVSLTDGADYGDGGYQKSLEVKMNSGDYLYTDTNFINNLEVIRSKVVWVVKKDDDRGNSVPIANSLGMESDLISLTPSSSRTNELRITGTAGEYDIYFYTYGSYSSEDNKTEAYTPTVVHLTIESQIRDLNEILNIGDSYNFAEAYNMTAEDFLSAFRVKATVKGGELENYAHFDTDKGILHALAEGEVIVTLEVKKEREDYVKRLMGKDPDDDIPSAFNITIDIVDRIYLDRSTLTISLGQTYQLSLVLNDTYSGGVEWSSSDDRYVTVSQTGLIKGVRITQEDVTVTATLDAGDGVYKTATCVVKVEAAVDNFTISPKDPQMMLPGEHLTVVANIRQTVSVAPLVWLSTDESVFTVESAADGKSAILTATGGGHATLTVYNPINEQYQTLDITVRVPISAISFSKGELSVGIYKEGYNMKNEISYTPANATDKGLIWTSQDTSVAAVDEDGYVTFKSPGTTLISVYPAYNPYNVMASCILTVVGTPEDITFNETDITMNVKDSRIIEVNYEPEKTETELTFTPSEEGIVTCTYDVTRHTITLVGQKPGSTNINIVSKEGLVKSIKVTVKQPSTEIVLSPKELTVRTGESVNLKPELKPADSTDTLTWQSYNTSVAKVDETGG